MKKEIGYIRELEKFLSFLKNINQQDWVQIENGTSFIKYDVISKEPKVNKLANLSEEQINSIIENLNTLNSREAGVTFINELNFNRIELETILKKIDIPFQKKDSIPKLKDKIIEGCIGYRLRSKAIQNRNDTDNTVNM